ncbi:MAG: glycosyltransferase family 1 protein, partial [Chloroflexi bacterium]|nr:glycosyltransferase family 1 protein [Chloroflexota bacterium]
MRIAIDATSVPPKPAGAGVYAIELVRALAERDRRDGYAL